MRRARRLAAGAALFVLGAAGLVTGAGAQSTGSAGFVATAAASGARVTYTVPNFAAVETIIDAGGPVAQAVLDSTGTSRSFASLPYPGDTIISLPGLISAGSGESFPVSYPVHAAAEHPAAPEAEVADPAGGYQLSARARGAGSDARARTGTPGDAEPRSAAVSHAAVDQLDSGMVRSQARSVAEGLIFGDGALRISRVVSEATTELTSGGAPVTTSRLLIEGASLNGTGVTFTPEGIEPLGTHVPLPAGPATDQLNEALANAGLAVDVLRGAPVTGGAQSDLLQITSAHPSPAPGAPEGTVVFRFGGVTTAVVAGAGVLPPGVPDLPDPEVSSPPGDTAAGGGGTGSSGMPRSPAPGGTAPDPSPSGSPRSSGRSGGAGSAGGGSGSAAGSDAGPPAGDAGAGSEAGSGDAGGDLSDGTGLSGSGSADRGDAAATGPLATRAIGSWERFGSSKLPYLALAAGGVLLLAGTRLVGGKDKEAWWIS